MTARTMMTLSKPPLLLSGGFVMAECGGSEPIELANIRKRMMKKPHGTHAVVTGAPGSQANTASWSSTFAGSFTSWMPTTLRAS